MDTTKELKLEPKRRAIVGVCILDSSGPAHAEPNAGRPCGQFALRRLFELPALFAVFFFLGGAVGPLVPLALAAVAVMLVGYFSRGNASLYASVLYMVLIVATLFGTMHTLASFTP